MSQKSEQYDAVFLHSRRETVVLLWVFAVFLVWCIGSSYMLGYNTDDLSTVWGIPRWVFWGVAVPWMGANVFTVWFAWFFVADDPLEEPNEDSVPANEQADQEQQS